MANSTVDFTDLSMVKRLALKLSQPSKYGERNHMTVILRPGFTTYNIIHTSREGDLLKDAMVVYRTGEHLDSEWGYPT